MEEAASLREEATLLERELATQQAMAGRGPLAIVSAETWQRHFWLVLAAFVGFFGFLLLACTLWHKKPKNIVKRMVKKVKRDPLVDDDFDDEENSSTFICGFPVSFWFVWLGFVTGFVLMWHYQIVQPFLRQLAVFVMIGSALVAFLFLMSLEAWLRLKGRCKKVVVFIHSFRDKLDTVLTSVGLEEDSEDSADSAEEAEQPTPKAKLVSDSGHKSRSVS